MDEIHRSQQNLEGSERMEYREDVKSIVPYLPLVVGSSNLSWPSQAVEEELKAIASGPDHSRIDSGTAFFNAITALRRLCPRLSSELWAPFASRGYDLFFGELMSEAESAEWFGVVVPALANLLLRLPSLLETHYRHADNGVFNGKGKTGLRLLNSQEPGMVVLSQELIGALLGCSLFCLFPVSNRGAKHLPTINFDHLFASLYENYSQSQENKIRCIIHYFKRICSDMPMGLVSFERKVLPLEHYPQCISYPKSEIWSNSLIPLCRFEVQKSGFLEDQSGEALEVDFANKYIGGGALHRGCVQEEIRFMICPELIAAMLFLPSMADNEAIEIVGAERFSSYSGYASSFRFSGDYVDKRDVDSVGRRKTRIVAIDALCSPRMRQYKQECLLREINKAFCGFFDQSKFQLYNRHFQKNVSSGARFGQNASDPVHKSRNELLFDGSTSTSDETYARKFVDQEIRSHKKDGWDQGSEDNVGIATGNWGCGAFGGDPELKTMIQWLAASQALRPFITYYTFGLEALQALDQVTRWILLHEWTVGDLWNMLVEYSNQKYKGETNAGFLTWLLPSLPGHDAKMLDVSDTP